jgi:dTDP-4-amino-4,6-dideoxygalactose transaminase
MPTIADRYTPGDSRHLVGGGPIASLEAHLCEAVGMRHAVCVANGTLGLMGAAMAMDLADREVVVPALAHAASVAGLLQLGARLRVADVDPDTLTLDVAAARRVVTTKTEAVLAVDLFGTPSNTASVRALADERGLLYLADAAQALGATTGSTHASSAADAVVLSFTTGKALDLGEGGAVLTNRRDIYERVVWHTQHPYRQRRDLGLHLVNPFAINMRMHPATADLATRELSGMQKRIAVHRETVARARRIVEASGLGLCLPIGVTSML